LKVGWSKNKSGATPGTKSKEATVRRGVFIVAFLLVMLIVVDSSGAQKKIEKGARSKSVEGVENIEKNIEKDLKTYFPQLTFTDIAPSPVRGIYAIFSGARVVAYYLPEQTILMGGPMIDKTGNDLSSEQGNQIIGQRMKDLPLDKAVKLGAGKNIIIEFTDPDCPYCRKAAQFFADRTDITKYTFFKPLPMHKDAENKIRYIFCSKDRAATFESVMKGSVDKEKYEVCKNPEVEDLLKLHKEISDKIGITSTPFFMVNGTVVSGADISRLEQLIGKVEKKAEKKKEEAPAAAK
jgi:thiol:disulfide interchange protein DsbC